MRARQASAIALFLQAPSPLRFPAFYEPYTVRYRALDHASVTNAYGINLNGEWKEENKLIGHATCSALFLAQRLQHSNTGLLIVRDYFIVESNRHL